MPWLGAPRAPGLTGSDRVHDGTAGVFLRGSFAWMRPEMCRLVRIRTSFGCGRSDYGRSPAASARRSLDVRQPHSPRRRHAGRTGASLWLPPLDRPPHQAFAPCSRPGASESEPLAGSGAAGRRCGESTRPSGRSAETFVTYGIRLPQWHSRWATGAPAVKPWPATPMGRVCSRAWLGRAATRTGSRSRAAAGVPLRLPVRVCGARGRRRDT